MSRILAKANALEWEQRKEQGATRRRRSEWVIDRLRAYVPPDHLHLANRLMDLQAAAEGVAPSGRETVDGGGNGREVAMHHRCEAQRSLNGFDAAVRSRLGANGSRCFWAIVWGNSLAETMRHCGYASGSHAMVRKLVQLVLMAAQEYDDTCQRDRAQQLAVAC